MKINLISIFGEIFSCNLTPYSFFSINTSRNPPITIQELIITDSNSSFFIMSKSITPTLRGDNPTIKINHCHVRLAQKGNPRNQKITIVNNKKYYCLLWGQYIVGGSRRGSYTFPSMTFSINQYIEQEDSLDPFDPFGFFRQPTYKKIPCKATSDGLKFTIIPEPQKTTQELLQSGKTVI